MGEGHIRSTSAVAGHTTGLRKYARAGFATAVAIGTLAVPSTVGALPPSAGSASVTNGTLTVTAAPGRADELRITARNNTNDEFRVEAKTGKWTIGSGCTQGSRQVTVNCSGVTAIAIDTGDKADLVRVSTGKRDGDDGYGTGVDVLQVQITTGTGNDVVIAQGILNANFDIAGGDGTDMLRARTSDTKDDDSAQIGDRYATATLDGGGDSDILKVDRGSIHAAFILIGSDGNDTLLGGLGPDTAQGGAGDDIINTARDSALNTVDCGDGTADKAVVNWWDKLGATSCEKIAATRPA